MPIHTSLPKIEGFQPIPNAVMIPFMEAQSAALAYGFGLNYEYGKRKIRSMSNDEYNSLTSEQIAEMSSEHTHIILQSFIKAVPRVMPAQTEIFKQYVIIEKAKVIQNVELAKWIISNGLDILLKGETGTDIGGQTGSGTITKGTSISQDAQGNVTTKHAPIHTDISLTETLPISDFPSHAENQKSSQLYTFAIPTHFKNQSTTVTKTTTYTRTHDTWVNKLNWYRNNISKVDLWTGRQFLAIITVIQTEINKKWNHFH